MSDYIDPAKEQVAKALRRGGALDTIKFTFVCKQCGKRLTRTWRQTHLRGRPTCPACGPDAPFSVLKCVPKDAGGHH